MVTLDDQIRTVLTDALEAEDGRGKPDHATRLRAAELLLRSQPTRAAAGEPTSAYIVVTRDEDGSLCDA